MRSLHSRSLSYLVHAVLPFNSTRWPTRRGRRRLAHGVGFALVDFVVVRAPVQLGALTESVTGARVAHQHDPCPRQHDLVGQVWLVAGNASARRDRTRRVLHTKIISRCSSSNVPSSSRGWGCWSGTESSRCSRFTAVEWDRLEERVRDDGCCSRINIASLPIWRRRTWVGRAWLVARIASGRRDECCTQKQRRDRTRQVLNGKKRAARWSAAESYKSLGSVRRGDLSRVEAEWVE
uniref:Uncharacterized protein n=1 Tax=Mycena chlorophos TaxID=658473 RepID=A0ABQ0KWN0_MYCCL|nr:predicted protein [Mycena chlorophos]